MEWVDAGSSASRDASTMATSMVMNLVVGFGSVAVGAAVSLLAIVALGALCFRLLCPEEVRMSGEVWGSTYINCEAWNTADETADGPVAPSNARKVPTRAKVKVSAALPKRDATTAAKPPLSKVVASAATAMRGQPSTPRPALPTPAPTPTPSPATSQRILQRPTLATVDGDALQPPRGIKAAVEADGSTFAVSWQPPSPEALLQLQRYGLRAAATVEHEVIVSCPPLPESLHSKVASTTWSAWWRPIAVRAGKGTCVVKLADVPSGLAAVNVRVRRLARRSSSARRRKGGETGDAAEWMASAWSEDLHVSTPLPPGGALSKYDSARVVSSCLVNSQPPFPPCQVWTQLDARGSSGACHGSYWSREGGVSAH